MAFSEKTWDNSKVIKQFCYKMVHGHHPFSKAKAPKSFSLTGQYSEDVRDEVVRKLNTAQKMKFSIKDFCSKCDQIRRKLWICWHLLKKSLTENFMFCAMKITFQTSSSPENYRWDSHNTVNKCLNPATRKSFNSLMNSKEKTSTLLFFSLRKWN